VERICAVTGSRADWGLLRPVLRRLRESPVEVQLVVTGSHLEPAFGHTVDAIAGDGFAIARRIPLQRSGDDAVAIADATARAVSGIARAIAELSPEMLLLLGDRYEVFAAAQAATLAGIPIAHIAGGDISEGANDDAMRHAITKLSHLHFTTNPDAARRVRQMGEMFDSVFVTGSPGIDAVLESNRLERSQLEKRLGFQLRRRNLAICFHPATLDPAPARQQVQPLLEALSQLDTGTGLVFTAANADAGGAAINHAIRGFVADRDNACFVDSLGHAGYYALLEQVDLLVGNSSSGLYEAPTLGTPTLDVGIRQQGRLRGPSVTHAPSDAEAIIAAVRSVLEDPPRDYTSPYGDGRASERIVDLLMSVDDPGSLLIKRFTELPS
jgi:UDP-hydrolysing UDP-N-acetyl-D-glucosamine 2-epimerase